MTGWPDEAREAAIRAVRADSGGCLWTSPERLVEYVFDALAPFVAAREAAAAMQMREDVIHDACLSHADTISARALPLPSGADALAAREAAAFKRGAEAMREACAAICDRHVERNIARASDKIAAGVGAMAMVARDSIRALPVPEDKA